MATRIALAGARYGATLASGFADLENAEIVAIADPDSEVRSSAAAALGVAHDSLFESLDDLLLATEVDAVIVASPTHLHERHVGAAFDRGLHVLCTSPVGVRGSEVSHIVTSAGLVGKMFMWANPLRFDPRVSIAQALVEAGEVGEPTHGCASIRISDWPHDGNSWRLERDLGGGALLEVGTQTLDALWFAMGAPDPVEAMASRFSSYSDQHGSDLEHPAEDSISGMVRFKNGACLQISAQIKAALLPGETAQSFSFIGTRGAIDMANGRRNDADGNQYEYAKSSCTSSQLRALAVSFLQAIETNEEPAANGKQALAFHKMVDALLTSAREKQAASIKVERSLDDLFGGL
ncbi:Gfo/Idh/MocA family oxidoreductase [Pelagicoccus sp. SDUM812002]|uniref:Gfo/Idh/MocA family protein n=1 Tax=Pelagicoccus sp. SDUM812002 TaxID=3041266 RepID=UPI00280C5479|nr:Gfo/Idh/MocA family oxidoreductase [Pelagicoccus sp. SDUM812002]MDQ8186522.1 Gfo/Idh/MocA family oxidoreductase [Pelagicoccus sp. SDUM812002]